MPNRVVDVEVGVVVAAEADAPAAAMPRSTSPTTITEEMALVTDISGVCSAGVTLHTTK